MSKYGVRAVVEGSIHFPEAPEHEGSYGLVGGEDVFARRTTFRSPTEAARWCEKVLRGDLHPRWQADGEVMTPHTAPYWSGARIIVEDIYGNDVKTWAHSPRLGWVEEKP